MRGSDNEQGINKLWITEEEIEEKNFIQIFYNKITNVDKIKSHIYLHIPHFKFLLILYLCFFVCR